MSTMADTTETTTNPDEYNGWTNRETWAASLHLSNDHGLYLMVNGWANEARAEAIEEADEDEYGLYAAGSATVDRTTVRLLADVVEDYIDELRADITDASRNHLAPMPGLTQVMMVLEIGSEWRVNWTELAENWLSGFDFDA